MINNSVDDHKCNICNKTYASYQSLWKHNKEFHKIKNTKTPITPPISSLQLNNSSIIPHYKIQNQCLHCNKVFSRSDNLKRHENTCKIIKDNNIIKETELQLQLTKEQKELAKIEMNILKLKLKIEASKKLDTKTFKSLNKALKDRAFLKMQNSNINSNNTNNIQNNNIINNNIQLIGFSKEEVMNTITNKEKSQIMANGYQCLEKFIEITNTGKYDQFKNIIITNIKDPYAYKFDDKQGFFVTCNKTEVLNELVNNRVTDIEAIYNEFDEANKINDKTKKIICNFLAQINDTQKPYVEQNENRTYENYFDFKVHKIKILLFDNQDKITKDIALFIEDK
jgi:hypothetical protein